MQTEPLSPAVIAKNACNNFKKSLSQYLPLSIEEQEVLLTQQTVNLVLQETDSANKEISDNLIIRNALQRQLDEAKLCIKKFIEIYVADVDDDSQPNASFSEIMQHLDNATKILLQK